MSDILIKGIIRVQRIKFYKDGFGILIVCPVSMESEGKYSSPTLDKYGEFCIKGNVSKIETGDKCSIIGKEFKDPTWGLQYNLTFMNQSVELSTHDEQKTFLSKIVTSNQLTALYQAFENPLEIIKSEDIEKLTKVKGLGLTTAYKLIEKYKATIDYSSAYIKLEAIGLSDSMIKKLCDSYGSPDILVSKFEENPYILCEDVAGIGFKKADEYALKFGIDKFSPLRIKAFIEYYLEEEAQKGNSWVITKKMLDDLRDNLGEISNNILGLTLKDMKNLWWANDKKRIGLNKYFEIETNIAKELMRLLNAKNDFQYFDWEDKIEQIQKNIGFEYTNEQKEGVHLALKNNVICITGLAGTGKTTITKAVLEILKTYPFAQCALSGKAAQRMTEVTGYEGYTIHRLLGFQPPHGFMFDDKNPLDLDMVILDETSMIGGELFLDLIKSIRTGSKLIILGDAGQLSSIGACNVFHDLLTNGTIPTVKLTQIHRQAQKSAVITESYKIRKREQIFDKNYVGKKILGELQDLELDIYSDKSESAKKIIMQFKEKLPTVKSVLDIQILVAMRERGDICTFRLNNAIQKQFNPDGENEVEISLSKELKYKLREGDKVINMKNNYKAINIQGDTMAVFNGNIGMIEKINIEMGLMVINFEGIGRLIIEKSKWNNINLGYVITTHKSQGSAWKCVIVGIDYSSYMSLSCEWLYTAITRAEANCVLVGENKAIRFAISQSKTPIKQTFLCEILKQM